MQPIQCAMCKHYIRDNKCEAYPDGIPADILTGQVSHKEPVDGDNGIQFKEREDEDENA